MCTRSDTSDDSSSTEICQDGLDLYAELLKGRPATRESPECLLSLGLVRVSPEGRPVPLPPSLAANTVMRPLEKLIERKQRGLAAARDSLHRAEEVYRSGMPDESGSGIRLIEGADVISATLTSAVHACQEELLTAQPGGGRPEELLSSALSSDVAALRRGVRQRTIYQHTVRTHGPTLSYVEQISAAGAEVRTLDEVFDRLIVCDRRLAFVPDPAAERRETALAIEHPGMVRYLVGLFEHSWERATPLPHSAGEHRPPLLTDETRRAILQLMVNGYTDDTIAGRLGMSTRTVASHVRKASELLGSRSRAQLAYLLAKSGYLDDEPSADAL
ncbi:helix-turn-helix transcriptional regulator [Streptomyces alkaliterrae]|uniref:LuxR family transcriptional regulator n=1 Tax=Streptomyces alkaliterrae TaxID=2213162 RepID=A0A5P0YSP2_9ACTN|nr:LuxR C-terminal-related transcriptional regulator [Streptomyces alkaliterrae]MBB1252795.1 LuxR family transcriptional regulator [Streptomyces alkaliterrae]MBB1259039.1 LuxR family transcriptional regulator [Streptomyces alkaliterrae]MQS02462.1 LuxR family transcriptional regulator [Streptomyces alkaliterrae]